MGKIKTKPYDSAEYLDTAEDVAAYLEEAFAERDPALIAHALGVAARARGMAAIAKKSKLSRESLYRALSAEGNPELTTLIKVLHALGLRLAVEPEKATA
jgi:probable addiction module antidote protein